MSGEQLQLIVTVVERYGHLSLHELAHTVCELLQWQRPSGALKAHECRAYLQSLAQHGHLTLPQSLPRRPRGARTSIPAAATPEKPTVPTSLKALQPIRLTLVTTPAQHRQWRQWIGHYHYLGYRTAFGASLRYLIETPAGPRTLGCLQFSSPAWRMQAREEWIGWSEPARKLHLQRLVNNSRFLLLPWVRAPHLASHVLSLAARAIAHDWPARYGVQPWMLETLVDPKRFSGTCYRAANWIPVGTTTGRGRQDRQHRLHGAAPKLLFLYPLIPNAPQRLQRLDPLPTATPDGDSKTP